MIGKVKNKYLKIKEAAKFLGICVSTLREWEKKRQICAYRDPDNKYRLFKITDLMRIIVRVKVSEIDPRTMLNVKNALLRVDNDSSH